MDALVEILKLKDGECWTWPESDYGKARIKLKDGNYSLFEIPTYGGEPIFVAEVSGRDLPCLIKIVESWT